MGNIKGSLVEYPVFDNEEFDFYQSGRLIDFMSTPDGIVALVMTDEGDEASEHYYIDPVPISQVKILKERG